MNTAIPDYSQLDQCPKCGKTTYVMIGFNGIRVSPCCAALVPYHEPAAKITVSPKGQILTFQIKNYNLCRT